MIKKKKHLHAHSSSHNSINSLVQRLFYTGLTRSLVLWFLLLSLLPMTIISWFSYHKSQESLYNDAVNAMSQRTTLQIRFIENWFNYRFLDIQHQAENLSNARFLQRLVKALQSSGKPPSMFVGSYQWSRIVEENKTDLVNLSRTYDYYYDLFLIDNNGNILFTLEEEDDLGTNLFTGKYKDTRFAHTARQSFKTGETLFSDLEYYKPRNDSVSGFLTSPLLDSNGNKIGLIAVLIEVEIINVIIKDRTGIPSTETSYLLGEDLLLRSNINNHPESHILNTKINTKQSQLWIRNSNKKTIDEDIKPKAFSYQGPFGEKVLGVHHPIHLSNINWALISEINENDALAPAHKLKQLIMSMLFFVFVVVLLLAITIADKLINPLRQLAKASQLVAKGHLNQKVTVTENNEIGQLADAFNHMLVSRQEHEVKLQESNKKIQQALDNLAEQSFALDQHAIVEITDIKGDIIFANEKFIAISGYSHDELIGQNHRITNSGYHSDEYFKNMYFTITSGKVWHGEICNKAKNGQLYWVDTTIVPFNDENGKPKTYISIRTNITARKQAEKELIKARDAAEDAARMKSEFLANMSHEIRTPMNGIIGMTELLLKTDLNTKQRTYAETTLNSSDALLTIINDILDFSKIEAGKLELEEIPFDLQMLVTDVAELMAVKCRSNNLDMLLRYKPGTPRTVIGDPGRIRQILLNLLSNAVKFTEHGHVLLMLEQCNETSDTTEIHVSVQDTGIGIPKNKQSSIFNQFDQVDGSTTRKYGGTGLGLSISSQLCGMMGSSITVTSKEGEGSTFSFIMKLHKNNKKHIKKTLRLSDYDLLKGLKTLIVDDIKTAQIIIKEQLAKLNMHIEAANSGEQALDMLLAAAKQEQPFDIVLTDFCMPKMDGEALARHISDNENLQQTILVLITSHPRQDDGKRLTALGFNGYLTKPTHAQEIPELLSAIFSAKNNHTEIPLVTRHTIQEVKIYEQDTPLYTGIHILLAEDNAVNQLVASEMLESYGCKVTIAANGIEVINLIKQQHCFDLIFMDCQMPEMDGFEATQNVRKHENEKMITKTAIIALTASAMIGDKDKCLAVGMDDYLTKPITHDDMEKILSKWLAHKLTLNSSLPIDDEVSDTTHEHKVEKIALNEITMQTSDDFKTLEVWDRNDVLTRMGGKEESLHRLVKIFIDDLPKRIEELQQTLNGGGINNEIIQAQAHIIKGMSGNIGAKNLHQLATELEKFAQNLDMNKIQTLWPKFLEQYKMLSQRLQQELEIRS